MSDVTPDIGGGAERDKMMSALFASMVMQHTNMAMIFLGQAPNPQTGQTAQDLEHAQYFIDQLEMLECKTKGNLDKQEAALLKQSLTHLRFAFIEAVEHPPQAEPATETPATPATPPMDEQETPVTEPPPASGTAPEIESHKKFSKKY